MSESGVNDHPVSNEADDPLPKTSPGARLAALREERGWSVEQVASQLNLAPRQILAIERDDYPALPGMAIVRGFVRAYAKLLKVDAATLLADLGGETVLVHESLAPQKSLSTPFADSRMPSMTERPGLSSKWVIGGLLIVLLAVGIWAMRHGSESMAVSSTTSASTVNDGAPGMASAEPSKSSLDVPPESNSVPTAAANSAPATVAVEPQTPAEVQAAPAVTPAAPTQPVAPDTGLTGGKDTLQLKVREESWIEVRRSGDNGVLLSRIVKPGETENVQVAEPVSVVIGNAAGVNATLRGSPVELKASAKSNVARINLK